MEQKNYNVVISVILVAVVSLFAIFALSKVSNSLVEKTASGEASIGTNLTVNPQTGSYLDELQQNVQAMAERFSGHAQYEILQADSQGRMQAVSSSIVFGTDTRAASLVRTGSIATFSTTGAASTGNVCDNPAWIITATGAAPTITLPPTSTLFADCMTVNGDTVNVNVINGSSVTTTVLAAGTGGTLNVATSTTMHPSKSGFMTITRDSATTYRAILFQASSI